MDLFSQLRQHARTRTETIAVSSARRSMTYRKLWSRIERATARLQMEWGVRKGDTVAYIGNSHPDALVLFFALARSGACLLPLAPPATGDCSSMQVGAFALRALIIDDDLFIAAAPCPVHTLSSLIASRCPHEPASIGEDLRLPALVLPQSGESPPTQDFNLARLCGELITDVPDEADIQTLFDLQVLMRQVLPVLQNGGRLILP